MVGSYVQLLDYAQLPRPPVPQMGSETRQFLRTLEATLLLATEAAAELQVEVNISRACTAVII